MEQQTKRGGKRAGAGRKAIAPELKTKLRSVYLTESQWDHCFRLFNAQGVDASEYIRRLVEADMKKHGKLSELEVEPSPLRFVEPGPQL